MTTLTLRTALKRYEGEAWTIATDNGRGWLYYFDGEKLHAGTDEPLDYFLTRECVDIYNRGERKHWGDTDFRRFVELEAGKAFIVEGDECGWI